MVAYATHLGGGDWENQGLRAGKKLVRPSSQQIN
jgi:hypothetical protein